MEWNAKYRKRLTAIVTATDSHRKTLVQRTLKDFDLRRSELAEDVFNYGIDEPWEYLYGYDPCDA